MKLECCQEREESRLGEPCDDEANHDSESRATKRKSWLGEACDNGPSGSFFLQNFGLFDPESYDG